MDAPQKRVEFLFVNKDSTLRSARSSKADTAKAINRHVQTTYFRTTSSKRRQHLQESAASVRRIARQGHIFKWRLPKNSSEEQESPKASSKETRPDRPRPSERPSPAKGDRSLELVPQHPFSHPLLSSELVLGKQLYSALHYYRSNSIFRTHETRLKAECGRHFPVLQRRIVNCLSSEMHMYALLSATAGRMAIISPPHERSAVKFMHQAAHVMREFLLTANPIIDSQIILNIYHLGLSEYYREDLRVAKIHLRILNELCHNLDLRNTYDRYLYDGICSNDIFVAIETPSSPCMPLCWDPSERVPGEVKIALRQAERKRSWDPYKKTAAADKLYGLFTGPFVFFKQPKIDAYNMNANIPVMNEDRDSGSGLEELVQSTLPSNAMRPILVDLISHLGTAARCSSQDTIVNAWLGKKNVAIMHRLASLTCDEGISECCRLACLIMLSYVSIPMSWRANPKTAARLREALQSLTLTRNGPRTGLIKQLVMWLWLVGMFGAQDGPLYESFLCGAQTTAEHLRLRSYDEIRHVARTFIHFDTAQHRDLAALVERLCRGKRSILS